MKATRLIVTSFLICVALLFGCRAYAGDATKFPTVPKMIEEFDEYSTEGRTFKLISEHPLHIQISPVVVAGTSPRIIESVVHMAAVETVYRAFIHTPVDRLTVTALPKTFVAGDGTAGDLLTDYRVSLTVTRKRALALLNRYFPGKSFDDLVTTEELGKDMRSKLFCRLTYPDQGSPGVEAVFVDLAQTDHAGTSKSAPKAIPGLGLASEIEKTINLIVDFTQTICVPGAGRQPDSYSFIILSAEPVFGDDATKKPWLLVAAGAVGKVLNDNPSYKADEVCFSDASLMKDRRGFFVDASLLKSLQKRIERNEITLEQMYAEITAGLRERSTSKP